MTESPHQLFGRLLRRSVRVLIDSVPTFLAAEGVLRAAALTYYTIFAIVPIFALCFGIAKGVGLDEWLHDLLINSLHLHTEILTWLCKFADTTLREARGGVLAIIATPLLCWTVIQMVGNIENSFNQVWHVPRGRPLLQKITAYLPVFLIGVFLLLAAGSAMLTYFARLSHLLGANAMLEKIRQPIMACVSSSSPFFVSWVLCSLLYFFLPNTKVRWSSALFGGLIAGVLSRLLHGGYVFIQLALSRYNAIYGSFAVLPLFLIWINLNWLIVLYGVNLSYLWQNFKEKEPSPAQQQTPPPAPRG